MNPIQDGSDGVWGGGGGGGGTLFRQLWTFVTLEVLSAMNSK